MLLKTINEHASLKTKALILTAFITGARQGEIAALEEKHIDFIDRAITFNQRITKGADGNYKRADGLKSDISKTIPVPDSYLDVIRNFMLINKKARIALGVDPNHKYIFGSPEGKFELPTSLYRNWMRFAKKHNLREIRFHDLRHTSASYLLSNPNITVKTVQEHLGHKDYRTTMNIYAHALEENKRETSNMFDNILTQ
ncbi:site-specific integrase [Enterococcus faecalis]